MDLLEEAFEAVLLIQRALGNCDTKVNVAEKNGWHSGAFIRRCQRVELPATKMHLEFHSKLDCHRPNIYDQCLQLR